MILKLFPGQDINHLIKNQDPSFQKSEIQNPKSEIEELAPRNLQLVTRNPQRVPRTPQRASRNAQPAYLFCFAGHIHPHQPRNQHHQVNLADDRFQQRQGTGPVC